MNTNTERRDEGHVPGTAVVMTPDRSTMSATHLNDNNRGNKEIKQTHSTHTKQITHKNAPEVLDPQKPQEHTHAQMVQMVSHSNPLSLRDADKPTNINVQIVYLQTTSPQLAAVFFKCLFVFGVFFNKER